MSDNDVSGMKVLDTRPSIDSFTRNVVTDFPRQRFPAMIVMLNVVIDSKNCALAIQACTNHSVMELKMSHVTMREIPGKKDVLSLLTSLEVG